MTDDEIRPAAAADVPAVKAVTDAAYHRYIERIKRVPVPMEADHAANVAEGKVFVTGDPVIGLVVLETHDDCCTSWTHARVNSGSPRSGSVRTR